MAKRDDDSPFARISGGGGGRDFSPEEIEQALKTVGKVLLAVPILMLAVWGALTSFYTVEPEERAVVTRFGEVIGISDPGLHFKIPFGIDQAHKVATERLLKEEFGFRTARVDPERATQYAPGDFSHESLMLTGDLNVIDVTWVVQYRISDPEKFLFQIRNPTQTLRDVSEAVMRQIIGNRLGSEALTVGRVEIALKAQEEIQSILDKYDSGLRVSTVELQDVVPPARVQPAFNEVNVARQERERMINEAEKRRNQVIPAARGEARQVVSEAEGYRTERINRAHGDVARFSAILEEYASAPEVTRRRLYLETMTEVLPTVGSVYVVQEGQPLPLLNLGTPVRQERSQ